MPSPIYRTQRYINSDVTIQPGVRTSGSPVALTITGPAHTALTASTEAADVVVNAARTVQFATGALTAQRAVKFLAPTYGFVGASTLSDAATVYIDGAPAAGTNATITRSYALWVDGGTVRLDGDVGIGTDTPAVKLHVAFSASGNTDGVRVLNANTSGEQGFACIDDAAASFRFTAFNSAVATYGTQGAIIKPNARTFIFRRSGTATDATWDGSGVFAFGSATPTTLGASGQLGFFGTAAQTKQTVTGSRGANAALASLLTALATYGIITDSSS